MKPYEIFMRRHPWRYFPIRCGEKAPPCFKNELALASDVLEDWRRWSRDFPGCNWGISLARSRIIVVDVDNKPGKVGAATWANLEALHGAAPPTLEVRTPSGGRHLYFAETNVVRHRHRLGIHGFGLDVDSTNYVLVAGSKLTGIGSYELVAERPVARAPDWFAIYLERGESRHADVTQEPVVDLDQPQHIRLADEYLRGDAEPAIEGKGGEFQTLLVAGRLKDLGLSEGVALERMAEIYNPRCEPRWNVGDGDPKDNLAVKVHNAFAYLRQTAPGAATAEADFADDDDDDNGVEDLIRLERERRATPAWQAWEAKRKKSEKPRYRPRGRRHR